MLILSLAVTPAGAATPSPLGGNKSDDRIELALRVWMCLPSGSFSVASRLPLPIEVDTGDFLAGVPSKQRICDMAQIAGAPAGIGQ